MSNKNKIQLVSILSIIIALTIGSYFWISKDKSQTTNIPNAQTLSKSTEIKNPIDYFYKSFSAKDYKVKTNTANTNEGYTFYYKKATIIRVDGEGKYNSQTSSIIKNDKLYTINDANKTFTEMDLNNQKSTYLLSIYKVASILDPIMQGETPDATTWSPIAQKSEDKNLLEYQTSGRNFISYTPGTSFLIDIKLALDSRTGLITSISIKSAKDPNWITTNFEYEEVDNIDSFINFPADYKKIDPT